MTLPHEGGGVYHLNTLAIAPAHKRFCFFSHLYNKYLELLNLSTLLYLLAAFQHKAAHKPLAGLSDLPVGFSPLLEALQRQFSIQRHRPIHSVPSRH